MPKQLRARLPADEAEAQQVRRLAGARTATFDTVLRARIIALSWDGLDTAGIAVEVRCHPKTVREWISRFNHDGLSSLTARPKVGRKPRLTDDDRRNLISLANALPESPDVPSAGGEAPAGPTIQRWSTAAEPARRPSWLTAGTPRRWTLDGLVDAARARGIHISRSQLRRILHETGFSWDRDGHWIPPVTAASGRTVAG